MFLRTLLVICCLTCSAWVRVQAGTAAVFKTPVGDIGVELYEMDKPVTVSNFLAYVENGIYTTNMIIHRWEHDFVIQGGGFYTKNRHMTNETLDYIPEYPAITNEYSVGATYSNTYGTLAMARIGNANGYETNSATSQWFFNLGDNHFLDSAGGGFTVFGHVIWGTNVLNKFNSPADGIYYVDLGGALTRLPVIGTNATYNALVYVDIQVITAQIKKSGSAINITWNSFNGRKHTVQYKDGPNGGWQTLTTATGTGDAITVADNAPASPARFYRVLVE